MAGRRSGPRVTCDAADTATRLRALMALGHPADAIAAEIGGHPEWIRQIARGEHPRVTSATRNTIFKLHVQWSRMPGPSTHTRNRARRAGWHAPTDHTTRSTR